MSDDEVQITNEHVIPQRDLDELTISTRQTKSKSRQRKNGRSKIVENTIAWTIAVLLVGLIIAAIVQEVSAPEGPDVTLTKFNRLKAGQTYTETCQILGRQGTMQSSATGKIADIEVDTKVYEWKNSEGSFVVVTFENNRSTLMAQTGLQ